MSSEECRTVSIQAWAVNPPVSCWRPHPLSHLNFIITKPKSWYLLHWSTKGKRLSRAKYCSKGIAVLEWMSLNTQPFTVRFDLRQSHIVVWANANNCDAASYKCNRIYSCLMVTLTKRSFSACVTSKILRLSATSSSRMQKIILHVVLKVLKNALWLIAQRHAIHLSNIEESSI